MRLVRELQREDVVVEELVVVRRRDSIRNSISCPFGDQSIGVLVVRRRR